MKLRQLQKLLALLFTFALIAAACGDSDGDDGNAETDTTTAEETEETTATTGADTEVVEVEGARTYGGTVTLGIEAESPGLRPWEDTCASPCDNILNSLFDKVYELDETLQPAPWVADSSTVNADFTEFVVTLKDGITLQNGKPVNAQLIADMFVVQQTGAVSAGTISGANLEGVAASGDLEVTYTLSQPNAAFLATLATTSLGMIFDAEEATADPDGASNNPMGSGAFMLESRDLDNETVLVRNPDYWLTDPEGNQLPFLDSIVFRPIPDEGTRLDSLLSGTVNAMQTLRQGTIRDARDSADSLTLYEFQGNNVGGGFFNTAFPPLDDVRVRKGLTHLNNQDAVIDALGGTGISLPGTQWFSPDSPWYSDTVAAAWPAFDFEAGVALLQEYVDDPARSDGKAAGEPMDVELSCPPDPSLIAAMQVASAAWDESGLVNTNLTNFDQQTHINNAIGAPPDFTGTTQAHCWRFSSDEDPSITINSALAPPTPEVAEAAGIPGVVSPLNVSNWFDPDSFTAAVGAIRTDDFDERFALYESIMLRIAEEVPMWYSGHTATLVATDPSILGLNGWHLPDGSLGAGHPNAEGRWQEVWIG